ncbi:MORC family CW-type zinc finger protein 3a [Archocentrus centrarchus]|uniref:MORC family CW-type zinc finger protein 3a n=1 Tax=Archocentrus centrarchus TaxID=63155 RepID=UPI0011E9DB6D|nr:MORC family CW-type zinc finger protein 3 [Archocentrus centrarchus]
MAAQTDHGVPLSTLSPKFLHSNSTSHTWPFSAIAELIDNAYDPDVSAKQFWIDKTVVKGKECLSFMDNGNGLDNETMHKMLSFGYSDKIAMNGQEPIGIYGNGFKSGSMRLGKDAVVFSKSKRTSCVGMLSQTYLEMIGANQIIVPIVSFEVRNTNKFSVREDQKASLQAILQFSPFTTQEELLAEIDAISLPGSTENTGTRIIIWNLRSTGTGTTEFDFETDRYDIRIPSDVYNTVNDINQGPDKVTSHIPESVYSLRAFCSILYLKPRMQVIIRGQKVKSQLIAKSLAWISKDHYKPNFLNKRIPITFGYNTKSKDQCGIMMYHKNRLIKAYERVGCQLKANNSGVGVIGVIECNFLDPTHNKQSFLENDKYRKTINNLGIKLEEYYKEIRYRKKKENPNSTILPEDIKKRPDQNWVQCDKCLRWRKLPDGYDVNKLPDKWFCQMNPDPQFRSCQVPEEPEDSDDDQPSYRKTYKQQEREEKMKQEKKRQKDRSHEEQLRLSKLAEQNEALRRQQKDLERQLRQTTAQSPSTPTTLRSWSLQGGAARPESSPQTSSTISQAACSPSSNDGLPVITSVCSLSAGSLSEVPLRRKRTEPVILQKTPKKPRLNGFHRSTTEVGSSVDVTPRRSPSVNVDSNDDDETDDDIVILETASTPKPKKTLFVSGVKREEEEQSENSVSMLLECSDDAAVDVPSETNAAGASSAVSAAVETSSTPLPHPELSSATTQTEIPKLKQEDESQNQDDNNNINNNDKSGEEQSSDMNACNVQQRVFKQESSGDAQVENQGQHTLQNGVNHDPESEENPGPSCSNAGDSKYFPLTYPTISEAQKQQDQLLELMQETAQERDSLKEQVQKLTSQLKDLEKELQEMAQVSIKKECSHQASQTEETGGQKDYKSLFEKAKQKINELIKDKVALIAVSETKANLSADQNVESDVDEIALQVDALVRKLDQRTTEKNELRSRLDLVEEENANLAAQCEELRLSLEHQRENAPSHQTTSDSVQTHPVEEGGVADSGAHSSSDASRSLMELRQNVGRLLLSYVPALDLAQVNYECNVIDEILEQVLSNMDSDTLVGVMSEASNN